MTGRALPGTVRASGSLRMTGRKTPDQITVEAKLGMTGRRTPSSLQSSQSLTMTGRAAPDAIHAGVNLTMTGRKTPARIEVQEQIQVTGRAVPGAVQAEGLLRMTGRRVPGALTAGRDLRMTGHRVPSTLQTPESLTMTGRAVPGAITTGTGLSMTGRRTPGQIQTQQQIRVTGRRVEGEMSAGNEIRFTGRSVPSSLAAGGSLRVTGRGTPGRVETPGTLRYTGDTEPIDRFRMLRLADADTGPLVRLLETMKRAFESKDLPAYLDPLAKSAVIEVDGRSYRTREWKNRLSDVWPFLQNIRWDYRINQISRVSPGRWRLNVQSTYRADLVKPLGVDPRLRLDVGLSYRGQTRRVRTLTSRDLETYVVERTAGDQLRLSRFRTGLFVDSELIEQSRKIRRKWQLKTLLFSLFYYYEQNRPDAFAKLVHPGFLNLDGNGFRHDYDNFLESVRADLDHLTNLNHAVHLRSLQLNANQTLARVQIGWDRRARLGNSDQLWLITGQETTFQFRFDSLPRLYRIMGDPVFGLSSAWTHVTLVRNGTLDGQSFSPRMIDDARSIRTASANQFPELGTEEAEDLDQAAQSTPGDGGGSGSDGGGDEPGCLEITSDITVNATWNGCVNVRNDIQIDVGVTLTANSGATVNVDNNVQITVNGSMDVNGSTFQSLSGSWGDGIFNGGLVFKGGSTGTIDNATLTGASLLIEVDGGNLTIRGSTLESASGLSLDGGTIEVDNSTIRGSSPGSGTGISLFTGFPDPSLTLTDSTISKFGQNLFLGTDNLTSSGNTFIGVPDDAGSVGVQIRDDVGSVTFSNEIFRDHGSYAICNETGSDDCNDGVAGGYSLTIENSDFIDNGNQDEVPAIAGGSPDESLTVELNGNYIGGNNTSDCVVLTESVPDDTVSNQYIDVSSVTNLKSTPNRASNPGLSSCGS